VPKRDTLDAAVDQFLKELSPVLIRSHQKKDSFIKAYILDGELREIIDSKEFAKLATNPRFNIEDLRELDDWKDPAVEYIKDYVPLNTFAA